ncbi:MAG: squalene/phytoene synthase family protein [Pseudomonadota bacterium]
MTDLLHQDDFAYCANLVKARDEDRWLAAQYAPEALRRKLMALYALLSECRRTPAVVSEAPLGEIRLQWHRDALQEIRDGKTPRRHPIVQEAAATDLPSPDYREALDGIIDASARPLYDPNFIDAEDFMTWLARVEGETDRLAVLISGGSEDVAAAAQKTGAARAALREVGALAPGQEESVRALALQVWRNHKPALRDAPAATGPAIAHHYLIPNYARRGARAFPVVKRLRLLTAIAFGR